jgi:hypothetical protein
MTEQFRDLIIENIENQQKFVDVVFDIAKQSVTDKSEIEIPKLQEMIKNLNRLKEIQEAYNKNDDRWEKLDDILNGEDEDI